MGLRFEGSWSAAEVGFGCGGGCVGSARAGSGRLVRAGRFGPSWGGRRGGRRGGQGWVPAGRRGPVGRPWQGRTGTGWSGPGSDLTGVSRWGRVRVCGRSGARGGAAQRGLSGAAPDRGGRVPFRFLSGSTVRPPVRGFRLVRSASWPASAGLLARLRGRWAPGGVWGFSAGRGGDEYAVAGLVGGGRGARVPDGNGCESTLRTVLTF